MTSKAKAPAMHEPETNGRLPKGWRMVRFDELAQMVNERVDPSETDLDIYVGLEHLDPDSLKIRRWGTPGDVIGDKLRFRTGDIIFGRRRAYQRKLAVAEFDGICSAHAMVVRASTEVVDPEFLPFLMQSDLFMQRAIDISVGSLSPTINWKTLRIQQFPLPPKDEQRRIAEILWAADSLIEHLQDVVQSLEKLSDSVFASACALNSIPIPLDRLTTLITDGDHNPPKRQAEGVPHVLVQNIRGGRVDLTNCTFISPADFERVLKRYRPEKNDVLIVCVGATIGRAGVVGDFCDFSTDRSLAVVRFDANRIHPDFGFALVTSRYFQDQVRAASVGTAQPHLFLGDIRRIKVRIPSRSKQEAVVKQLAALREGISQADANCNATRNLKACLLREVLRGL